MSGAIRILVGFTAVALGCGGTPTEPEPARQGRGSRNQAAADLTATPAGAQGYRHSLACSRFRVGAGERSASDWALEKVDGPDGVFSVAPENGAVWASPKAGAPALLRKPFGSTSGLHNERVRQYFLGCGMPADQIGGVHVSSLVQAGGSPEGLGRPALMAWYSSVKRVIEGFLVADSVAWARFNEDDQVVAESVYWPAIDASVLADAQALRATLENPARAAFFLGGLPAEAKHGKVAIRHSSSGARGSPFVAFASLDVDVRSRSTTYVRHFDVSGAERRLPQEQSPAGVRVDSKP
jgi:hypothetical protein